jgi:hypothetical protein
MVTSSNVSNVESFCARRRTAAYCSDDMDVIFEMEFESEWDADVELVVILLPLVDSCFGLPYRLAAFRAPPFQNKRLRHCIQNRALDAPIVNCFNLHLDRVEEASER